MAKNLDISVLLDFYGQMLTEKQQEVAEYYFNDDLSLAEIAEHSGITRQGVRDSIKRAEFQLLEYEEKLGLWARFAKMQTGVDEILRLSGELLELNGRIMHHPDFDGKLRRISELAGSMEI